MKRFVIVAVIAAAMVGQFSAIATADPAVRRAAIHTWTQVHPSHAPSARFGTGFVWDAAIRKAVLFGGCANDCFNDANAVGDTWEWNGQNWTRVHPPTSPSVRSRFGMAYDAATKNVVLFGGDNAGTVLGDTWTFNGTTWTKQSPTASPSPRWDVSMAYDNATKSVVLFGGSSDGPGNGVALGDTWTWTGNNWSQQAPPQSPPARFLNAIGYDQALHKVVLYGGDNEPPTCCLGDTWAWNGATWTPVLSATSPGTRCCATLDQISGVLVGDDRAGTTWQLLANGWQQWHTLGDPSPRYYAALVHDPVHHDYVLFGGFVPLDSISNETWLLH